MGQLALLIGDNKCVRWKMLTKVYSFLDLMRIV